MRCRCCWRLDTLVALLLLLDVDGACAVDCAVVVAGSCCDMEHRVSFRCNSATANGKHCTHVAIALQLQSGCDRGYLTIYWAPGRETEGTKVVEHVEPKSGLFSGSQRVFTPRFLKILFTVASWLHIHCMLIASMLWRTCIERKPYECTGPASVYLLWTAALAACCNIARGAPGSFGRIRVT